MEEAKMDDLTKMENLLKSGKISRREFLVKTAVFGAAATLSPALFANTAKAAGPKKGGRFRMGMVGGNTTDSMDPGTLNDAMNQNLSWQIRNNLVEVDDRGNLIPELAESWEASPDAATWTFKIRKGVEFHNGKSLTAEDVIASINHHRGEKTKSAGKAILAPVKEVKADGKHIVIFTLDSGNADFPAVLTDFHYPIFPSGTQGADFEKGIGTGPYVLKTWEPGVRSLATRNPNYWKEGRGHFDEVQMLGIPDVNARTSALLSKQIDFMNQCELKTVNRLEKAPGINILKSPGNFHFTLPMMVDKAPFNNNDVRLALKYAIDREKLLKQFLNGYGRVGNDHPISPNYKYFAKDLPQRQYDPDKAKFHLKKAGMEGTTFKLHTSGLNNIVDAAILYKEQASKAGVQIETVLEPTDGYWANIWLKKPWVSCFWNGRATVDLMFSTAYSAEAKWNDTHWKNPRFNELLKAARAELDEKKRGDMYEEMQRLCSDDGGQIVYLFKDYVEATNKKVGHGTLSGNLEADGCRNAERWWFES